jgi:hypothetical protein
LTTSWRTTDHRTSQLKELTAGLDQATKDFRTLQAELSAGKGSLGKAGALQQRFDTLTVKWTALMDRMTTGQGTLGQLTVNPELSQSLDATTHEFQELFKGLQTNPKKFISLHIF